MSRKECPITPEILGRRAKKLDRELYDKFLEPMLDGTEGEVPEWVCDTDSLAVHLYDSLVGKKYFTEPSISAVGCRQVRHARDYEEAVRGLLPFASEYYVWSHRVRFQDVSNLPITKEEAVKQICVISTWIGDKEAKTDNVLSTLKRIAEGHGVDILEQIQESFILAGTQRREKALERIQRVADDVWSLWIDRTVITYDDTWWPAGMPHPDSDQICAIKLTETLGGKVSLLFKGSSEDNPEDNERKFDLTGKYGSMTLRLIRKLIDNAFDLYPEKMLG